MEAGHIEDVSCIILPDFTGQEVEDFLGILYLAERGEGVASVGPLFTCLVEGADLFHPLPDHKLESGVKGERKAEKTAAEIKMEDVDIKMKKKIEELVSTVEVCADGKTETERDSDCGATKRKEDGGPFRCSTCGKVFRVRRVLAMHEQVHSEPRLACPEPGCTRRFRKRFNLKAHVEVVHRGAKHFPCKLCGKQYYNESKLKAHTVCHAGDKFICQHCPSIFAAAKSLRAHIRAQHSADELVPRCTTCGKIFSTEMNLKSHISRVHLKEKRCACPTCGKLFFENRQLGRNIFFTLFFSLKKHRNYCNGLNINFER